MRALLLELAPILLADGKTAAAATAAAAATTPTPETAGTATATYCDCWCCYRCGDCYYGNHPHNYYWHVCGVCGEYC